MRAVVVAPRMTSIRLPCVEFVSNDCQRDGCICYKNNNITLGPGLGKGGKFFPKKGFFFFSGPGGQRGQKPRGGGKFFFGLFFLFFLRRTTSDELDAKVRGRVATERHRCTTSRAGDNATLGDRAVMYSRVTAPAGVS